MSRLTPRTRLARRFAALASGLAAACALTALAAPAAAHASTSGYTPNPREWYFSNWTVQQDVWPSTQGAGVTVALVDSGVQANLPDLQGVVKPGADMFGEPGNGQTDYGPNGGHGTEMAELIAGQGIGSGQFGIDPVGLAPQAKILPVHAINPGSGSGDGMISVANGIKYAASHGAQVINLSLAAPAPTATSCDPSVQQAVSYALSRNVVVVAGSGDINKGDTVPQQPASCAGVLAVGGVEPNGALWKYSTHGANISVAAPGDQMYVTSANGQQYSIDSNGTSGASALVSAAAALIRSKYPKMPWYTVDQRLINTTVSAGQPKPNDGTGYGIINVAHAVDAAGHPVAASAPDPPYTRYKQWLASTGQPAPGGTAAASGSGGTSTATSAGPGILGLIGIIVIVLVLGAIALIIVLVVRGRNRRGPRGPQGPGGYSPGGYPPNTYAPPPGGQYPAPGQQFPPGPGQAPPPAGPYAPQAPQYPQPYQPGQYPPPGSGQPPR